MALWLLALGVVTLSLVGVEGVSLLFMLSCSNGAIRIAYSGP